MRKHCAGLFPAWQPCSSQGWASGPWPAPQVSLALGVVLTPTARQAGNRRRRDKPARVWDPNMSTGEGTSSLCRLPRPDPPLGRKVWSWGEGTRRPERPTPGRASCPARPRQGTRWQRCLPGWRQTPPNSRTAFKPQPTWKIPGTGDTRGGGAGGAKEDPPPGHRGSPLMRPRAGAHPALRGHGHEVALKTRRGCTVTVGGVGGRGACGLVRRGGAGTGAHAHSAQPRSTGLGPRPPSVRNLRTECTGSGCWGQAGPA